MNESSTQPLNSPHYDLPPVRRWAAYVALCIGMFMAILDIQVVITSLHVIEQELGIGPERMSWVQTSYLIAEVVAIPIIGLLMRVFAKRRLFALATIGFTIASAGCAASVGFWDLMAWRILQGFTGGVLIPLVFSAVFLMFPRGFQHTLATSVGGFLAILGPTLGPLIGGWITQNASWQWIFLINIGPGVLSLVIGLAALPKETAKLRILAELDWFSLTAFGVSLGLLIIGLKEAPERGWLSPVVLLCFALFALLLAASIRRAKPAIQFHLLHDRALAFGCGLSFLFGFVLFSTVYILPVFLAFVRGHGPLAIGLITVVMGITQIIVAPFIVQIDRFFDVRLLTAFGFSLFAVGLALNADLTPTSDYDQLFWPQVIRGAVVMFCVLPSIRLALSLQPLSQVNDASGLFNVVRNIGGAIGIAVMDTVMFSRAPEHAERLLDLARSAPELAAPQLGLAPSEIPDPEDAMGFLTFSETLQAAGLTLAINECFWLLAALSLLTLPLVWWMGPLASALPVKKLATS